MPRAGGGAGAAAQRVFACEALTCKRQAALFAAAEEMTELCTGDTCDTSGTLQVKRRDLYCVPELDNTQRGQGCAAQPVQKSSKNKL